MVQAHAITKSVRVCPRKARLSAGLIRGKTVPDAMAQLTFSSLKGGRLLLKTLISAVANAENEYDVRRENLRVAEVRVDVGPVFKRAKPKNRGGKHPIMKRTSHFTVIVAGE
jgi:large subunit ribosomal protein L22